MNLSVLEPPLTYPSELEEEDFVEMLWSPFPENVDDTDVVFNRTFLKRSLETSKARHWNSTFSDTNLDFNVNINQTDLGFCNSTNPGSDTSFLKHTIEVTVIYCLAYFTVFVLGIFGNCFVVAVVARSPRMRTVTNYFIVNLALADILVIIFCLPATLLSSIFTPWVLGWIMCKSVSYVQGLSVAASIYSLLAVSFDRFLAICYPLRYQFTKSSAKIVIVIIWIAALIIPVPWFIHFDLVDYKECSPDIKICLETWPNPEDGNLYFLIANILLCYIVPLLFITYCYAMIWARVWSRDIPCETKDRQMSNMVHKSKIKVVKMLVVVVILFMVSWLPLYVTASLVKYGGPIQQDLVVIIVPIAQWLGSANSCINPILYAFFNKKYRNGFAAIIKSRRCCGKLTNHYYKDYTRSTNYTRSTISVGECQKSRQWRNDTQMEVIPAPSDLPNINK